MSPIPIPTLWEEDRHPLWIHHLLHHHQPKLSLATKDLPTRLPDDHLQHRTLREDSGHPPPEDLGGDSRVDSLHRAAFQGRIEWTSQDRSARLATRSPERAQ